MSTVLNSSNWFTGRCCETQKYKPANTRVFLGALEADSEAIRNRLVKGSKSQTRQTEIKKAAFFNRAMEDFLANPFDIDIPLNIVDMPETYEPETADIQETYADGTSTVIEFREWSEEYRIRTQTIASCSKPPQQSGARVSEFLSNRAARNLADSCEYMARHKGGYKTFVTGTFSEEKRQAIKNGETTIQKEVTRTMDSMKKIFLRGWEYKSEKGKVKINPAGKEFHYCWVVEVPKNEKGEDNPHVHIMMGWRVKKEHFTQWSERIEKLWSNGYFHLEKIKNPEQAGAYMAKAAGYMSKGKEGGQGRVIGNRYGISKPARAPKWAIMSQHELGIMGLLIRDCYYKMQEKFGPKFEERRKLNNIINQLKKEKKTKSAFFKEKAAQLATIRKQLAGLPVRASKYQLVIKKDYFPFFQGRLLALGWSPKKRPQSLWLKKIKHRFENLKRFRGAWFIDEMAEAAEYNDRLHEERKKDFFTAWECYQCMA